MRQQMRAAKLARHKRELVEAGVNLSMPKPSVEARREKEEELKRLYVELFPKDAEVRREEQAEKLLEQPPEKQQPERKEEKQLAESKQQPQHEQQKQAEEQTQAEEKEQTENEEQAEESQEK